MNDEAQLEVIESTNALASIERVSIDQQVATAHQFPRSIKQFMADAKDMVTLDLETAEGCYYRLERKDKKTGEMKVIEGPSVRLLEIAASCYGNIRYGSRVIAIEEKFVVTQGVAHDLQRNVFSSSETRRRITTSGGFRFGDDMIGVTANAACAIAKRNALNGIVPRVYVNQLCDLAMETSRGTTKTLTERRTRAIAYFKDKLGVTQDKLLAKLGRAGVEEISLEDLDRLNGLKTAIKEGDTTVDAEFNPQPEGAPKAGIGDIIGKPSDKTAPAASAEPEQPVAATPEEKRTRKPKDEPKPVTPVAPQPDPTVLQAIETAVLDGDTTEMKLLTYAREQGLVPEGVTSLWKLPADALAKIAKALPGLKEGAK